MWILHKVFLKMTKISILQASALALFLIVFSSITMRAAEPETFPRFIDDSVVDDDNTCHSRLWRLFS